MDSILKSRCDDRNIFFAVYCWPRDGILLNYNNKMIILCGQTRSHNTWHNTPQRFVSSNIHTHSTVRQCRLRTIFIADSTRWTQTFRVRIADTHWHYLCLRWFIWSNIEHTHMEWIKYIEKIHISHLSVGQSHVYAAHCIWIAINARCKSIEYDYQTSHTRTLGTSRIVHRTLLLLSFFLSAAATAALAVVVVASIPFCGFEFLLYIWFYV